MTRATWINCAVLVGVSSLLVGCGGTDNSAGSVSVASLTPTPTPTPTPSPTPTPTASSSANATASDYSQNASFNAAGLRLSFDNDTAHAATAIVLSPENSAIGFDFTTALHGYKLRFNGETLSIASTIQTLTPYYQDTNLGFTRGGIAISQSDGGGNVTPSIYSGYVAWSDTADPKYLGTNRVQRYMLFGNRTLPADLPQTGNKAFKGVAAVNTSRISYIAYITYPYYPISFAVDYGQRGVTGTMTLSSTAGPIVVTFAGALDSSNGRVSGTIGGGLTGSFEGALYGPAATELSLLYVAQDSGGTYYGLIGTK